MLSVHMGIFELVHSGDFGRDLLEGSGKQTSFFGLKVKSGRFWTS